MDANDILDESDVRYFFQKVKKAVHKAYLTHHNTDAMQSVEMTKALRAVDMMDVFLKNDAHALWRMMQEDLERADIRAESLRDQLHAAKAKIAEMTMTQQMRMTPSCLESPILFPSQVPSAVPSPPWQAIPGRLYPEPAMVLNPETEEDQSQPSSVRRSLYNELAAAAAPTSPF